MLLQEEDQQAFKRWILPKLERISTDADAEVLADYVIALVTSNDSEANVRRNCIEQLSDFIQDATEPIVNEVLQALKDKSYLAGAKAKSKVNGSTSAPQSAPIPSIVGTSNYEYEPHPPRATNTPPFGAPKGPAANTPPFGAPKGPAASRAPTAAHRLPDRPTGPLRSQSVQQDAANASRKRKLVEPETSQSRDFQDPHYNRNGGTSRPLKHTARMGGWNARGGGIGVQNTFSGFTAMPNTPNFPPPPPGPPPFDPANPMALFSMAAAFGVDLSSMPPLPLAGMHGNWLNQGGPKAQCKDYHTKGFCALGNICPYEHGDAIVVPADEVEEYDPEQAFLAVQSNDEHKRQGTTRGKDSSSKGGRARAEFSLLGASNDPSNTSLVVEQIPEAHFSEDNVRGYFSQFGTIVNVQMQKYKHLAIIKFEHHHAAVRAYNSPKAVFDNRFVKVYWYQTDSELGSPKQSVGDDEMDDVHEEEEKLDLEEVAKRQADAQKAFEERRRKEQEAAARAEEIEKQLEAKHEEIRKVKQQLAALSGDKIGEAAFSQTLATLQAEADGLFSVHEPGAPPFRGRGAFRGGYRGRGYTTLPPRGRGYTPSRGSHRGRGFAAAPFHNGRSSVRRLDNRPKRLAVAAIEADSAKDEALRQYLLNVPDCTSIERHPEQADTLIITFKERYQAEIFLDASRNIPDVGKLELSWVPNDAFSGTKSSEKGGDAETDDAGSPATVEEEDPTVGGGAADVEQQGNAADADMDVADDVDQWL